MYIQQTHTFSFMHTKNIYICIHYEYPHICIHCICIVYTSTYDFLVWLSLPWDFVHTSQFLAACQRNGVMSILTSTLSKNKIACPWKYAFPPKRKQGCRFVPYTFSETKPQMVPKDLNVGFQGLALIQAQIYNFVKGLSPNRYFPATFAVSFRCVPRFFPSEWDTVCFLFSVAKPGSWRWIVISVGRNGW